MPDPIDRLGTALSDRYRIERELGRGGMAIVYLAEDLKHRRKVALKVLEPELAQAIGHERFLKEIEIAAQLNHPHILPLHDSGEADGLLYYVMPYVEGETLRHRLSREKQLPLEDTLQILEDVADALSYAHSLGVIHRDIKPENIMFTAGHAVVADFGIAKAVDAAGGEQLTETGLAIGTPTYMSPEQASGQRSLDGRSDTYSLACVAYEMLGGEPPFTGTTPQSVMARHSLDPVPPIRTVRPTVSASIERALEKALAKVPADRFRSTKEFAEALTSETPVAPVPAPPRSSSVWRRRLGYAVPAAVAALVVAWALLTRGEPAARAADASTIRAVTSFAGWEMGPSWSPDGSMITYSHIVGGSSEIATLSLGGGDPNILTDNPADEVNPRWSPDGSKIAFVSDRGTGSNIYWIPPTGGAERKLVETHIPFLERPQDWYGAMGANPWSPDGQELLFSRLHPTGEIALWRLSLATREQTQITFPPPGAGDVFGSWSNDGQSIVFTRNERAGHTLLMVPAAGGEPSLLLGDQHYNAMAAWSPDDRRLVFVSSRGGAANLWEMELGTRRLHQLTVGTGNDAQPVFAQNGTIAYSNWNHQIDIYWMRPDAPEEEHERLTSFTGGNFGARVSPDGGRVLYFADRAGFVDLWLLDRTTGQHRQLTDDPSVDKLGDWSPDGKEIVFLSDRGGALRVWVLNVESGVERQLTSQALPLSMHPAEAGGPRWSPDGSVIGYLAPTEEGSAIWLVRPDGSDPHPSTVRGALSFCWYGDGQRVLYTRLADDGSGVMELRAEHLGTGEQRLLLAGAIAEVDVSPDGSALSFVEAKSHFMMNLHLLPLARPAAPNQLPRAIGEPQQVTFGGGVWHVHNGGWAPDGSGLVYSRDRDFGDIYIIEPGG